MEKHDRGPRLLPSHHDHLTDHNRQHISLQRSEAITTLASHAAATVKFQTRTPSYRAVALLPPGGGRISPPAPAESQGCLPRLARIERFGAASGILAP